MHIIARGKIARSPEAELVARYEKRLTWPLRLTELPETGGRIPEPQTPCKTVLLDERGQDLPSEKLAAILERWRDGGMRDQCAFYFGRANPMPRCVQDVINSSSNPVVAIFIFSTTISGEVVGLVAV